MRQVQSVSIQTQPCNNSDRILSSSPRAPSTLHMMNTKISKAEDQILAPSFATMWQSTAAYNTTQLNMY